MGYCAAVGCNKSATKGGKMHKFPRDKVKRKLWELKLNRSNFTLSNETILCSVSHSPKTNNHTSLCFDLAFSGPF